MNFQQGNLYHVYNRGNNKQKIFFNDRNYLFFLEKAKIYIYPNCDILAWCLMPNHFHFLIHANEKTCELSKTNPIPVCRLVEGIRLMLSSFTKAINKQEEIVGNLFQQKTKSKLVFDARNNYSLTAFHYIHQNPLKARLVNRLEDWRFSSFADYSGIPSENFQLCNKNLAIKLLAINPDTFMADSYGVINDDLIKQIF